MASSNPAIKRILQECKDLRKNPSHGIVAAPLDNNLFEWHFTIKGADKTEFEGGKYHGKFILPSQYPFKAPDIIMLTKSGRFEVGKKICLNFTGYHHELWQPAWTIRTMLTALRAFMDTPAKGIGAMAVDKPQRKKYAKLSIHYKCPKCKIYMKDIEFPMIEDDITKDNNTQHNDTNNDTNNDTDHNQSVDQSEQDQITDNEPSIQPLDTDTDIDIRSVVVPSNRKDRLLDSFTVFLVLVIVAILLKKFASKVIEQL